MNYFKSKILYNVMLEQFDKIPKETVKIRKWKKNPQCVPVLELR